MPEPPDALDQRDAPAVVPVPRLITARLVLREWRPGDLEPFAALNADPEVTRFFPAPLSRAESEAFVGRIVDHWRDDGFGLWAVERLEDGAFLGCTGLGVPTWAPGPETEVGWRFARSAWGHGYATEAGRAAVRFAFQALGLPEIVSYTTAANQPSRRVMERLGMTRDPAGDFPHPRLAADHPLRPHVTYRLTREEWVASEAGSARPVTPSR